MIIRALEMHDLDEIMKLELELFPSPWAREDFIYELEENPFSHLFVMEEGNEIVAYAGLWVIFDKADLTSLAVRRSEQGKGYAKQLLSHVIEVAKKEDCEYMLLEVRTSNLTAQKLYEKFGFIPVGIKKNYYSDNHENAITMAKVLVGDEDERY